MYRGSVPPEIPASRVQPRAEGDVDTTVDSQGVVDLVAREAELLDDVTYRLSVLSCLAESGQSMWVARATADVEESTDMLRLTGLLRATRSGALASMLGLDPTASLSAIVAAAPPDHAAPLDEARRTLAEAIGRAQAAATGAQAVLGSRAGSVQEALENLGTESPTTYVAAGVSRSRQPAIVRSLL